MHPEIENLINMALADGEVTEKERGIILRKAESLGLDKDEVEMILDGKIALMNKTQKNDPLQQTQTNKAGYIKKCPSCGAPVESFNTKCSECGHEFRGIEASKTISKLFEKLDSIEKERDTIKLGGLTGLLGGLDEASKQMQIDEIITRKKAALIRDFPIPNTREELLELLHFIHPKIFSGMSSDHDKGVEKEKARLELITDKVNDVISNKDYEGALMLCAQLKWEYSDSYSTGDTKILTKAWDEKREKIIEIINQKANK